MVPVEEKPGLQTIGSYDLIAKIAEGGMGTVYKGRHQFTGEVVAIKIVPPHLLTNPVFLKRFEQEYHATKEIDHPNIVRTIDFGREGDAPYLVMEYVEGESLGQRLDRTPCFSERDAIQLISQVAQGLHKAHKKGLIHRDVKPDNILITPDGQAKLTDFGLIKEIETDLNLTRTGRGLGTPHFMAPEQFRNAKNADVRCDIYSLAATLYQMVTGELPFKSLSPLDAWMKKIHNELPAPRELLPTLSERVDWAIRRSMSADPQKRAATCREFVEDLTGQSTRRLSSPDNTGPPPEDLWYMVYKDEQGVVHTVKGSTDGIRRSYKEGYLGDAMNIRVARTKQGQFDPLKSRPEFRDLIIDPTPRAMPGLAPVRGSETNTPLLGELPTVVPPASPEPTPKSVPAARMRAAVKGAAAPRDAGAQAPSAEPASIFAPGGGSSAPPAAPRASSAAQPPFIVPALPASAPKLDVGGPHIRLERTIRTPEWVAWTVVILIAMAVGVGLFFLTPVIYDLRLFW